ncbi:MAG: c-type cytochrome [Sphingomonadaceae bacterium]
MTQPQSKFCAFLLVAEAQAEYIIMNECSFIFSKPMNETSESEPENIKMNWISSRRAWVGLALAAVLVVVSVTWTWQRHALADALVRAEPASLQQDGALVRYALDRAPGVYAANCASCHGAERHGDLRTGAADLADAHWVHGKGDVAAIETTILYGIRSGHPKAHGLKDMPAMGRTQQLTRGEISDLVDYMLALSKQPHAAAAAERGRALYAGKGRCADCHGADAGGSSEFGAPRLTGPTWLYGGQRAALQASLEDGRHGLCPAWIHQLDYADIRALAVWLAASQPD